MAKSSSGISIKIVSVGLFVIACVVLIFYAATLNMGFYTDDYTYLEYAGRLTPPQYLVNALDPQTPFMTWRPLLRLIFGVEYSLFRFDASYYHLVQILLHLGNCLLLFGIVRRLSQRWRLAFVASLLYAGLPVYSWAVFWVAVHDPSATFFYLSAIWFWIQYIHTRTKRDYVFALSAFGLALLGKETSVTVPAALFLIDRWFIRDTASVKTLLKRYAGILIVLGVYAALEYIVQSNGIFVTEGKYSLGPQILPNLVTYLGMLIIPLSFEVSNVWVGLIAIAFVLVTILKRSPTLTFIGLLVLLNILPVLAIPWTIQGRYLYLAAMGQAIILAMFVEWGRRTSWRIAYTLVGAGFISGLVIANGFGLKTEAEIFSEIARQNRVPFRDIMRQYPTLPSDTLLYFIEPPGTVPDIQGMFFQRYGAKVVVKGTFEDGMSFAGGILRQQPVRWRDHALSMVYYFADDKRPVQVSVDSNAATGASLDLPSVLNVPIQLEGYEITGSTLKRNDALALLLYWRSTGKTDKDYTVFVHLVDQAGHIFAGDDSPPRSGNERTSKWRANQLTADGHVIVIPQDIPAGEHYRLEVGMYDPATMERTSFVDDAGNPISDKITIEPFKIVE